LGPDRFEAADFKAGDGGKDGKEEEGQDVSSQDAEREGR
jgi:hypothetical protein